MQAFQAVLGSVFSLMGAVALFALVMKAFQIGNEITEMKDLLREVNRNLKYNGKEPLSGQWLNQSALDDADASDASDALTPSVQPQTLESSRRESW